MDKLKMILMALVLMLAAIGALMVFGLVAAVVQYLFFFGVLILAGWVVLRVLKKSDASQLEARSPHHELEQASRVIEEVRQRQLAGK